MNRTERIGLGVAMGGALLLRLPGLSSRPLWLDEALSATIAVDPHPWQALATRDLHPPLQTGVLRALASLSHAEALLRLPSLLASVATVPAIFWAARAWKAPHAAMPAAVLAAVLPSMAAYGAEARPYALGVLGITLVVGLAATHRHLLAAVVGALTMATLYGAWPVVFLAAGLHAVRSGGASRFAPIGASLLTALSLLATLTSVQRAHEGAQLATGALAGSFWTPATLFHWLPEALSVPGWMLTARADVAALVIGAVTWPLVAIAARTRRPEALALLALGPAVVFALAAGMALHPFGPTRHLLVLVPGLLLFGLGAAGDHAPRVGAVLATVALLATPLSPGLPVQDVPGALARIGDAVVLADGSAGPAARWYGRNDLPTLPWRRPERLADALDEAAPTTEFWFLLTRTRTTAPDAVRAWADARHRPILATLQAPGVLALQISPGPDPGDAPSPADGSGGPAPR